MTFSFSIIFVGLGGVAPISTSNGTYVMVGGTIG